MAEITPVAELAAPANKIVESMRQQLIRAGFGVTVQGAHVTVRWYDGDQSLRRGSNQPLRQVTMIVDSVSDGVPDPR